MDAVPHVFVVMPFGIKRIGPADIAGRVGGLNFEVDFDAVYKELIEPALKLGGYEPFRADQEPAAGSILTDMYFELVTAEFVLADISIINANVFYELGVRHAVKPRGTIALHAGWYERPFDVFPERTFRYDGNFFKVQVPVEKAKDRAIHLPCERKRLSGVIRQAFEAEADGRTISSPVYTAMPGLREVSWEKVETARVKYFRGALDKFRERIEVARRLARPGDILTLSEEAPTPYHGLQYKLALAQGFIDLGQFKFAQQVLQRLSDMVPPDDLLVNTQLCFVLNRLGNSEQARTRMSRVLADRAGDPEAQGAFGRIQKDLWRARWSKKRDEEKRRSVALTYKSHAQDAINSYANAFQRNPAAYYVGINVVTLANIILFLHKEENVVGLLPDGLVMNDLVASVKVSAAIAARRTEAEAAAGRLSDERVWAEATLGELALAEGQLPEARRRYQTAASLENVSQFQISAMLDQLKLLKSLGYRGKDVAAIMRLIEKLRQGQPGATETYTNVIVGMGSSKALADREAALRNQLEGMFEERQIGAGDLTILGGLGTLELVLGELSIARRMRVHLMLPAKLESRLQLFDSKSSALGQRWFTLADSAEGFEVFEQKQRIGPDPLKTTGEERNKRWIANTAWTTPRTCRLLAIVERDGGSPDGFEGLLSAHGAEVKEITI